jgi:hypothetical protein
MFRAAAIVLAVGAGVVGVWRGTWAAGGSDSSCYALMAQAFAGGNLQPRTPLAAAAPWANASTTFAPGGFIPSPIDPAAASPVCAPGFSLLLAPFYAAGGPDGIFLVTPLAGALLVYLTFVFGRQMANEGVGLASALLVATSPVFVFQVVQPMNDVAIAALWLLAVVLLARHTDSSLQLGLVVGLALLVRPNLAPAAAVVGIACATHRGVRGAARFAAGAAPFLIVLAALNVSLYGHMLATGYGSATDLFALGNVSANVQTYGQALISTQLGFPLLGFAAAFVVEGERRRVALIASAIALAIVAIYMLYRPLPEWWYLRFLLPALAVLTVLAVATLFRATRRAPILAIAIVFAVVTVSVTSSELSEAWDLVRLERRFRLAGETARDRLPRNAVYLSVWESGTVRFHALREAVVWDALPPQALDGALSWLSSQGYEPHVMIEDWEEPLFRQRFGTASAIGQLDWPPAFVIDSRVRVYKPADRERYHSSGETSATEYVWGDRR